MLGALTDFAAELRTAGIPVSMVEVLDAAAALGHTDLGEREAVREALAATLVKHARHRRAFDTAFDVFFGWSRPAAPVGEPATPGGAPPVTGAPDAEGVAELAASLVEALRSGDRPRLRALAGDAVERLSGFRRGRPVAGRYYRYRVMQRLDEGRLLRMLASGDDGVGGTALDERLRRDRAEDLLDILRAAVGDDVLRRLVEDRGAAPVADTVRLPLVEDLDLMYATAEELAEISARVQPLARKLASRLAARRRHGRKGRLDVRRTIRRSLSHGGVLLDPRWRPRRVGRPEIVLLCDVSGSMATFSRFTMKLTYAIGHAFSNVRSFAFVDGVDEVTGFFGPGTDFDEAMVRMSAEARVVGTEGHSDYGSALELFVTRFPDAVTPRSTVIVTGDARNNYRASGVEHLLTIAREARALHWLNPEGRRYWDTGDSIMSVYHPVCDAVHEVRTLRQLEQFVATVAVPGREGRPLLSVAAATA